MATMASKRVRKKRVPTERERRAIEAREKAQKLLLIQRLFKEGESIETLATLTGFTPQYIGRVLKRNGLLPKPADDIDPTLDALLTPAELRECRRENASDPEALAWLAGQRTDRRHNGRPMPNLVTNADEAFEDLDDSASLN